MGDSMLYTAVFTKKTRLFQRAYTIDGNTVYITDTKKGRKKFLKSGIRNVVFKSEDAFSEGLLKPLYGYDRDFIKEYLSGMTESLVSFLKPGLPLGEAVVTSKDAADIAVRYARTVYVTDKGEDEVVDGVNVIFVKKIKRVPHLVIKTEEGLLPDFLNVPTVDITEGARGGGYCLSWRSLSFKCDLLPYEINTECLLYLLKTQAHFGYELTSCRKKCPMLFTFL
ncbi:MAG: hypothetical protein IKU60_00355 [Clostridia bacterium]|nr:hypothetical protein [Clostridia bacterium]